MEEDIKNEKFSSTFSDSGICLESLKSFEFSDISSDLDYLSIFTKIIDLDRLSVTTSAKNHQDTHIISKKTLKKQNRRKHSIKIESKKKIPGK